MVSSYLSLRSRLSGQTKSTVMGSTTRLPIHPFRDYQSVTPQDEALPVTFRLKLIQEYVFEEKKKKSLHDYDRAILGFRFGDALDLIIKKVHHPLLAKLISQERLHLNQNRADGT